MTLQLVKRPWPKPTDHLPQVALLVPRLTLMKRRWQMEAPDGAHFGFDLETPLQNDDVVFESESTQYVLVQEPEPVLELPWNSPEEAARLGWSLGNLHFPVEIRGRTFRVSDDPAVRQLLDRSGILYQPVSEVFRPLASQSHSHAHGHAH